MLLALNDVETARAVLSKYDKDNCHVLIEFAYLITESCACGPDGFAFYQHIRSKYQLLLRKDTSWGVLFDQIDHMCFGQPKKVDPMSSMLSSMFGMMGSAS